MADPVATDLATLRDLVTMRTGLPRHDWCWQEQSIDRAELASRLAYLQPSVSFREKFQYNNISVTIAGHVAETVANMPWEALLQTRILSPLGMHATTCVASNGGDQVTAYHETPRGTFTPSFRLAGEATAPSGGAVHSTLEDMASWVSFNLGAPAMAACPVVSETTLRELHAPQIVVRDASGHLPPDTCYALGWYTDYYAGGPRLWHGGYIHNIDSHIALMPERELGVIAFTNFGQAGLARFIAAWAAARTCGEPAPSLEEHLAAYRARLEKVTRQQVGETRPAPPKRRALDGCVGTFCAPGYGTIVLATEDDCLVLHRGRLRLALNHDRDDQWVADTEPLFPAGMLHPFDGANRIAFTFDKGRAFACTLHMEPAVAPIRFVRVDDGSDLA